MAHLAGDNIGPGWQEKEAELDFNEFMANCQVCFVYVKVATSIMMKKKNPHVDHFLVYM